MNIKEWNHVNASQSNAFSPQNAGWNKPTPPPSPPNDTATVSLGKEHSCRHWSGSWIGNNLACMEWVRCWVVCNAIYIFSSNHKSTAGLFSLLCRRTHTTTSAHSHMLLSLACTAQHPPMHPLHASEIITNSSPPPMHYNVASFHRLNAATLSTYLSLSMTFAN